MSSSFASAIAAAFNTIDAVAGETVTYRRGSVAIEGIVATPGSTAFDTNEVEGAPITWHSSDWTFNASVLVIGNQRIVPRRGDTIEQTIGLNTIVFEVLTDGNQVYRYCDRGRTRIRVHTKEMKNG